ncbi:DUF350 domain-containing protein [Paenibacillus abyssi]|uniref:DUF350 domain-containing protein n=1 Tax=Paenibacillus abyssi TaxID=1340531 RepID=A0A917D3M1_9BACL|nr:DUF350 domain-containing protein [Paenibacillus abyssi]GGG09747.1 DUF350 domain-containing protein [Paenibacillus abyssi]
MTWTDLARIPVWTGFGALLLIILMMLDSLFTRYKDFQEIKAGNVAVTTRFMMKLFAQSIILYQAISKSSDMWEALILSIVSFIVLLVLEWFIRILLKALIDLRLDQGIREGKVAYALFAGSIHLAGALIIGAI